MKVIISENRIDDLVVKHLDKVVKLKYVCFKFLLIEFDFISLKYSKAMPIKIAKNIRNIVTLF